MTKEDFLRCLIHIPWGMLGAGLCLFHPLLGFAACFAMLAYEAFNDWRKGDESYKDVLGIVWGVLIGGYTLLILDLLGVLP